VIDRDLFFHMIFHVTVQTIFLKPLLASVCEVRARSLSSVRRCSALE